MNVRIQSTLAKLLLALLIAAPLAASSRVEELFQKALVKESVERDLDGAVHIYQQVIDEARGDRAAGAEARLRMGICFEKLGKTQDAAAFYHQILAVPAGVSSDILQQTRTHLRRIEFEQRMVLASSTGVRGITQFIPSRYDLLVGPSLTASSNGDPTSGFNLGLRYRISTSSLPVAWYLDAHGTAPLGGTTVARQGEAFGSQSLDTASLSLKYQASLGILGELPHGAQRTTIPEVGIGLAFTHSNISYISASSSGDKSQTTWRPYLETGVHLFPDNILSLHLGLRYSSSPYPNSVDIASPAHSQTFNFPSSSWMMSTMLQIKLGHRVVLLVPDR